MLSTWVNCDHTPISRRGHDLQAHAASVILSKAKDLNRAKFLTQNRSWIIPSRIDA